MMRRFALLIPVLLLAGACGGGDDGGGPTSPTTPTSPSVGLDVPFAIEDLTVGTGQEAMNGDTLSVNYTGWLYDPNAAENKGTQFDSGNFSFTLGAGRVIQGWELAPRNAAKRSSATQGPGAAGMGRRADPASGFER